MLKEFAKTVLAATALITAASLGLAQLGTPDEVAESSYEVVSVSRPAEVSTSVEPASELEFQEPAEEYYQPETLTIEPAPVVLPKVLKTADDVAELPNETRFTTMTTQGGVTWGLDLIDGNRDGSYTYVSDGAGVRIYIVDTGVDATHREFGSRVIDGFDSFGQNLDQTDCNGHGTHVAGIAAGGYYGVAKAATIVPVRVLDCTGAGNTTTLIDGIDWILSSHPGGIGIVNMSLGGVKDDSVNAATSRLIAAGLVVVAAAGNSNVDACTFSPASAPGVIAVGAVDQTEAKASFSNWGTCVDVSAPGSGINSANALNHSTSLKKSGTSQASPFVAGAIATYIASGSVKTNSSAEPYMDSLVVNGIVRVESEPESEPEPSVEPSPEPTVDPEPVLPEPEPSEPPAVDEPILPDFEVWVTQVSAGSNRGVLHWVGVSDAESYEIHKTSTLRPGWRVWDVVPGTSDSRSIVDKPGVTAIYKVVAVNGSTRTEIGIFVYEPK